MMNFVRFHKLVATLLSVRWLIALIKHGVAPSTEHINALRGKALQTIVDVGANIGQFTLLMRTLYPESKVLAFEPLKGASGRFKNLFRNDKRVRLFSCAIAQQTGEMQMNVSNAEDSSSLLEIGIKQTTYFPGTQRVGIESVQTAPLNVFLKEGEIIGPALLKIDVQGFELEVLRASEDLLLSFDWIYCECSYVELYAGQALAPQIVAWLHQRGLHLAGSFNQVCDSFNIPIQADLLFRRA